MDKLAVVFLHHEYKNRGYLNLAIESLLNQNLKNVEIVVVDSSESEEWDFHESVRRLQVPHTTGSAVAANIGVKAVDQSAKYLLFANDDVIFAKGSVKELMIAMGDNTLIMNAFSNTDTEMYYWAEMPVPRFYDLEDIKGKEQVLMGYPIERRVVFPVPFVCFYATMMPLKLWNELGGLDENFTSGPDDRDFCMRAAQKGVPSMINLAPTIWHAGGKTIATKNQDEVAANRVKNAKYFEEKWKTPQ